MESNLLAGRLALVTGGGGGIGSATARALGACGARAIVADLDGDRAETVARDMRNAGHNASSVALDVADFKACRAMADRISGEFGPVSILINNAGFIKPMMIDDEDAGDSWDEVISVNLTGVFNMCRAFAPALRSVAGSIVNVSSIAGYVSLTGIYGYVAAKTGVRGLTRTLARELGRDGVRVNAVAPSLIRTPMTDRRRSEADFMQQLLARTPLAAFITGATLPIDGGYLSV